MQTTGSRPKFRGGLFALSNADLRAGYRFRRHQHFAACGRSRTTKEEQELAARESLNSTWTCARNLTELTQLNRGLLPLVRSREQYIAEDSFVLVLNAARSWFIWNSDKRAESRNAMSVLSCLKF